MAKVTFGPTVSQARGKVGDTVFTHNKGNVARALSLAAGNGVGPHNLLSVTHPDTTPATPPARGSLISGQAAVTLWKELPLGDAGQFLKSDGVDALWSALPPPDYPGTGSIVISQAALPASLNLSTEGTIDWYAPAGSLYLHRMVGPIYIHRKALGGWICLDFDWLQPQDCVTSSAASPMPISTEKGDDTGYSLTNYALYDQGMGTNLDAPIKFGFCLHVPASTIERTLNLYVNIFSCTAQMTCRLSDASVGDTTDTINPAAAALLSKKWTIVFNAARDGQYLNLVVLATVNKASHPYIRFICATMT